MKMKLNKDEVGVKKDIKVNVVDKCKKCRG
jgi:hypothetical protein